MSLKFAIVIYCIILWTDIWILKEKNYKIKTRFVRPEGPKVRANKKGINFMICPFIIPGKLSVIQHIHDFSVGF